MAKKGKFQQPRTAAAQQHVNKSAGKKKKKKKNKKGAAGAVVAIVLVILLVAAVGIYAYGTKLEDGKTIYPNVRVAGVDVGGMTASAAQEAVEQAVAEAYLSSTLEVHLPDRTLSFDPEQTNVALDADLAIKEAMAFGRSDGPFQAVLHYLDSSRRSRDIELETALYLDTDYIQSLINQTAAAVKTDPVNSSMGMDKDMTQVQVQVGTSGRKLDTEALYEAVYDAFQSGNFEPLTWEYEILDYQTVKLEELHKLLADQITDAYYDEEAHKIVDGVSGYTFELAAAQAALDAAAEGAALSFPLEEKQPELTAGKLTNKMFGTILEQRSSVYVNNPKRTENLRLACEAINGTIINPGEVFSFNEVVGERTEEKGYQPATIYGGDGESVDGVGGGVCQVASTIYYAALYLDLETVMREPHMYVVTYVPAGCDATIYWDSGLDYKFKNTLDAPIKIQANIDGGKCNITFWGAEKPDYYVELSQPKTLETWNEEDVEELDETKPVGYRELKQGAYTGSKVVVTKKVFDNSGKLLSEKELYSTYKARPRIYVVGPTEEVPEEPVVDPENPEVPIDPEIPVDPWAPIDPEVPEEPETPDDVEDPWAEYWP